MTGRPDDALLARYLVGACSEAEQARVEEAFFADDEVFERMQQIEDDLIDRHLQDRLDGEERERFREAYATGPRRDRVDFARTMTHVLDGGAAASARGGAAAPAPRATGGWPGLAPGWGIALAAAAVIVFVAGASVWQMRALRSSLETARSDNEALRQQQEAARRRIEELEGRTTALAGELARERENAPAPTPAGRTRATVATFVLAPGLLRSARGPVRIEARGVDEVRLRLDLDPGIAAERFRAELRGADTRVLWVQEGLTAAPADAGSAVLMTIPAAALQPGEYEVVLSGADTGSGLEEVGRYYFDVTGG